MSGMYMLLGTLVALGVLVTIHEYGHFWVARRCGVKVLRFSIGFGTPLIRWHDRHGTLELLKLLVVSESLLSQGSHSLRSKNAMPKPSS